MIDEGAES
jgi:hypothetical protein